MPKPAKSCDGAKGTICANMDDFQKGEKNNQGQPVLLNRNRVITQVLTNVACREGPHKYDF